MSWWQCRCGTFMRDLVDPNPAAWNVWPEPLVAGPGSTWETDPDVPVYEGFKAYLCPKCGRAFDFSHTLHRTKLIFEPAALGGKPRDPTFAALHEDGTSHIPCRCGTAIPFGFRNNTNEFRCVPRDDERALDWQIDELLRYSRRLLRCPSCGRLWVFCQDQSGERLAPLEFVPVPSSAT